MTRRRLTSFRIAACALMGIMADISYAEMGVSKGVIGGFAGNFTGPGTPVVLTERSTGRAERQLTFSQPPHDIIPLDDVLAEFKPDERGSLVGVRLMQHRSLDVYRLRILKETGGVVDLYVNARTGAPL
jgi:hypothetical protein